MLPERGVEKSLPWDLREVLLALVEGGSVLNLPTERSDFDLEYAFLFETMEEKSLGRGVWFFLSVEGGMLRTREKGVDDVDFSGKLGTELLSMSSIIVSSSYTQKNVKEVDEMLVVHVSKIDVCVDHLLRIALFCHRIRRGKNL